MPERFIRIPSDVLEAMTGRHTHTRAERTRSVRCTVCRRSFNEDLMPFVYPEGLTLSQFRTPAPTYACNADCDRTLVTDPRTYSILGRLGRREAEDMISIVHEWIDWYSDDGEFAPRPMQFIDDDYPDYGGLFSLLINAARVEWARRVARENPVLGQQGTTVTSQDGLVAQEVLPGSLPAQTEAEELSPEEVILRTYPADAMHDRWEAIMTVALELLEPYRV